jgi:hypothetical protein
LRLRRRSTPFGWLPRPGPEPWRACLVDRSQTSKAREGQPSVGSNPTATALGCPHSQRARVGAFAFSLGPSPRDRPAGCRPRTPAMFRLAGWYASGPAVSRLCCGASVLLWRFGFAGAGTTLSVGCARGPLRCFGLPGCCACGLCGVSDCRRANALVPHAASWGFGVGGRVGGFWWVGLWLVRGLFSSGLPTVHSVQAPCLDC